MDQQYEKENDRLDIISIANNLKTEFLCDVLQCFSKKNYERSLPFWWLYDKEGSQIFEEITEVPEYYPTKCELAILKMYSESLVANLDPSCLVVELGSGSSKKTRVFLEAFLKIHKKCTYIPIDISREILISSSHELLSNYKDLHVIAMHATYDDALKYFTENWKDKPKVLLFLGSSIGNLTYSNSLCFLKKICDSLSSNDKLILGMDLMKDHEILKLAYVDPSKCNERFILNIITRMNKELFAELDLKDFKYDVSIMNSDENDVGRVEMYIKCLKDMNIKIHGQEFFLKENERIHIENSHKYTRTEIEKIANLTGFANESQMLDSQKKFSLNVFVPSLQELDIKKIEKNLKEGWELFDYLFTNILTEEALYMRPIELRHPFIFYFCHCTAFEKNQIFNYVMQRKSSTEYFDTLFERGMDPIVDFPSKCHKHSIASDHSSWPSVSEIEIYKTETRKKVLSSILEVLENRTNIMSQKGRVFKECHEHTLMHIETLLYMIQNLDDRYKRKISLEKINFDFQKSLIKIKKSIKIPAGFAKMGADFHKQDWGWDNEFPAHEEYVDGFEIDEVPVTNREFVEFIESGQYDNPNNWTSEDWQWKEKNKKSSPTSLFKQNGKWMVRTCLNSDITLENAEDWPVYCSQAEAAAFAKCWGKRLPTEAEYIRAAYGFPEETLNPLNERKFPWGNEDPIPGFHGNFDFYSWAPMPIGSFPNGRSAWGVYELVGNGWEWTCSNFKGFPGFEKYLPYYQGYSEDFFDKEHFVMLGASWATKKDLIRRSFRNWFQNHYEFMFSKFRCVKAHKI